jgi:predicted membrane-bound spermidine synthase
MVIRLVREYCVALLFFVSGTAGLIFEVVWFYRCGLVFGNTAWATSIVLSSFMGGLALGNALVALFAPRMGNLLKTYAVLEAVVAITGFGLTVGLPRLANVLVFSANLFPDHAWFINVVRLVTAFSVLLVPATAMGATFPVVVGVLTRGPTGFGRVLGRLYGLNTLGAVVGVIGAEIALIPYFGVLGTASVAALLDVGVAAGAFWMSRYASYPAAGALNRMREPKVRSAIPWRILACAFLAGALLMALEVEWFRLLSILVVRNTLAVSLMLAVVLAAIGLGGLAASSVMGRKSNAEAYLPAIAAAAGMVMVGSYGTFQYVIGDSRVVEWSEILWLACWLTVPTSMLSGVMFTMIGEMLKRDMSNDTRTAGWLMLANTAGAVVGPPAAAFVLVPTIGMERSFFALFLAYVVLGVLAIRSTTERAAFWAMATAGVAAIVVAALFPLGLMSREYFPLAAREYANDGSTIVATREGSSQTIFLMEQTWNGKPIYHRLVTDGFSMSGTAVPGKRYMRYFVYLPMLLRKAPLERVLVICYGVGVTAGAATDLPSVKSVDVVDISSDIVAMSDLIYANGEHPLRDPRVRVHFEDGRYFLQSTDERFDLITGEPPPPLTPGSVNIYTREFFQLVHGRLAEGGVATYWLPVARQEGVDLTTIIGAFCAVFDDCSLWNGSPADLILLGTRGGLARIDEGQFSAAWKNSRLGSRLREVGFEIPEQIGATFVGDAAYLRSLTAATAPLIDNYPRRLRLPNAGFPAADPRFFLDAGGPEFGRLIDPRRAQGAFAMSTFVGRVFPQTFVDKTLPFFDVQRIINRVLMDGANILRDIEHLHALLMHTTLQRLPYWLLGLGNHPILNDVDSMPNDGSGQMEYVKGLRALVARDYVSAAAYLAQSQERGLPGTRPVLIYALCMAGHLEEAHGLVARMDTRNADQRHFRSWIRATFGLERLDR